MLKNIEDYEKILSFISLIDEVDGDFCYQVLDALKEIFGYHHLSLFVNENAMQLPIALYMKNKVIEKNTSHYYEMDIFNIKNKDLFTLDELLATNQFKTTKYYMNFLKENKLDYTVFLPFRWRNTVIGAVGVHKTKACGDFSESEKQILESASKYITSSLNKKIEKRRLILTKELFEQTVQNNPVGVIIVDKKLSIVYHNDIAKQYCSSLTKSNKKDPFAKFKDVVLSKLNHKPVSFTEPALQEVTYQSFKMKFTPATNVNDGKHNNLQYTIYIYPKSQSPNENPIETAKKIYGLSKRETEIIRLIAKGYSNNEISEKLFVSINTVKSHLNNIFNKLGVNNRTSVLHKITKLH